MNILIDLKNYRYIIEDKAVLLIKQIFILYLYVNIYKYI